VPTALNTWWAGKSPAMTPNKWLNMSGTCASDFLEQNSK
jgi:hypothetical protein